MNYYEVSGRSIGQGKHDSPEDNKARYMQGSGWIKFLGVALVTILLVACKEQSAEKVPEAWKHLMITEGQAFPIPVSWLSTPEGRVAHSIKLPDTVPNPVPFDFAKAAEYHFWEKEPSVAHKYFDNLCATEAGEWVFKRIDGVEGLYFARPKGQMEITDDYLKDPYGPEAPAVERHFQIMIDSVHDRGQSFIAPPHFNYKYVEEPHREVGWQAQIQEPYIRLFGYTSAYFIKPGQMVSALNEVTPMQVMGIAEPSAQYAYTWRGITRPQGRMYRIAGAELMIYDRHTLEPIGLRRTFAITGRNRRGEGLALWMLAPTCNQAHLRLSGGLELTEFAERIIPSVIDKDQRTIEHE